MRRVSFSRKFEFSLNAHSVELGLVAHSVELGLVVHSVELGLVAHTQSASIASQRRWNLGTLLALHVLFGVGCCFLALHAAQNLLFGVELCSACIAKKFPITFWRWM